MKYFTLILCIGFFFQITHAFEFTEVSLASEVLDCNDTCEVSEPTTREGFFNKHIPIVKKLHESINKTIEKSLAEFPDKEPIPQVIAKIVHDTSNLGNTLNTIVQSKYFDDSKEETICKSLCKGRKFLEDFSLSFVKDLLGIPKDFKTKVTGDWFKNGMFDIGSTIKTLEKHLQLEDSQVTLLSFLPLIKNKHRELLDTICKILRTDNETFIDDVLDFNRYAKEFSKLMEQIGDNAYLLSNKNRSQFKAINSLVNELHGYFINLLTKYDEIMDEINANKECYDSKSDAFIQDVMYMLFLYKYNKIDYKQMNNKVFQLITKMKSIQESKK